jgi:hypothetical protein
MGFTTMLTLEFPSHWKRGLNIEAVRDQTRGYEKTTRVGADEVLMIKK